MSNCVIIIPVYKTNPNWFERKSLVQCLKIFKSHPICLLCSPFLDLTTYKKILDKTNTPLWLELFDEAYFQGLSGYNELMTSVGFYERFSKHEYMLVYQLDAYVFKDELSYWCKKNYGFLGAPLPEKGMRLILMQFINNFPAMESPKGWCYNGGFSLRNNSMILSLLRNNSLHIEKFLTKNMFEDVILCVLLNMNVPDKMPSKAEATKFSFESYPRQSFSNNNHVLPMGCHAWFRNDFDIHDRIFWFKHVFPYSYPLIYLMIRTKKLLRLIKSFFMWFLH